MREAITAGISPDTKPMTMEKPRPIPTFLIVSDRSNPVTDVAINPAKNMISINFSNKYSGDISVSTIHGREVKRIGCDVENNVQINISHLSPGVYIISGSNQEFQEKIIIQ